MTGCGRHGVVFYAMVAKSSVSRHGYSSWQKATSQEAMTATVWNRVMKDISVGTNKTSYKLQGEFRESLRTYEQAED